MLSKWKNSVGALVLLILLFGDDAALTKNDNNNDNVDVDTKIDVARRIMRRRRNF